MIEQEGDDQHEGYRQQQPGLDEELPHDAPLRSAHTAHHSNLAATGVAAYPEGAHHAQEDAEQGETRQGVLQAELVGDTALHGIVLAQLREFLQAVEIEVADGELRCHFLLETLFEGRYVHTRLQTDNKIVPPRHIRASIHFAVHGDNERIRLLVVAVLEVAEYTRYLQSILSLVDFLSHGIGRTEQALSQPFGDECLVFHLFRHLDVTTRTGILHAIGMKHIAAIGCHKAIRLGMYETFPFVQRGGIGIDLRTAPRVATRETLIAGDGPTLHLGLLAHDAGKACVGHQIHRVGSHVGVEVAVRLVVHADVYHVKPFGIVAPVDGTVGGQYIDRVDNSPKEETDDQQFQEYPAVLTTLVP